MWKKTGALLVSPAFIVIAAFLFRMGLVLYFEARSALPRTATVPIGYEVGRVARSLALGKGFSSPLAVETGPTVWFAPVYPLLLGAIFKIFGVYTYASALVAVVLNCIFSAFTCWPIYLIGQRAFSRGVGIGAAWVWVFLPTSAGFAIEWVWDTSLSALLLALIVLASLHVAGSPRARDWVGYGLLWALGGLTNPALLSLLPFVGGWAGLKTKPRVRHWLQLAGVAGLAFFLAVLPWFVRNYLVFNRIIFFRSNFGLELWLGNNDQVPDSWSADLHPNDNAAERAKYVRLGELAYMAEKERLAVQFIRTHPADFARFVFHRFMNNWTGTWGPPTDALAVPAWNLRALVLHNCLFSILSFLGLFFASRGRLPAGAPLAWVLLVFPLTYYISHTSLRYRHPIDPIMAVLATFAIVRLAALVTRRQQATAADPAGGPSTTGIPHAL